MPLKDTGVTGLDPLAEYLAGVEERATQADAYIHRVFEPGQDDDETMVRCTEAQSRIDASQADVATLVEMVRRCQEHLIAYRPGLPSGSDKTLCELDVEELARAAMEKSGG